jgi:hypothetical protein
MTQAPQSFIDSVRFQARLCEVYGSPFSGVVLDMIADDMAEGGPFASLATPWVGLDLRRVTADAGPLRVLGGLHYLVLSGAAPELAALYPPAGDGADRAGLSAALVDAARAHQDRLAAIMTSPPQTNEVARSRCLVGGFLTVATETGLPLRCLEIGSSAGLNQNWNLYCYEFGEAGGWGAADSPVRFVDGWTGGAPPANGSVSVVERAGCDQNPIDIGDPDQALRLQAYVWPDQAQRLGNLRAAIDLARTSPPNLERIDAAEWAKARAVPVPGVATVLFHSVVWQYLSPAVRDSLRETIAAAAKAAAPDQPFAWLRMEPSLNNPAGMMEVRLSLWPGGEDRLLAIAHPHGATVDWQA